MSTKALKVAISQLGVQEEPKGSNRGPQVDRYLASVGLGPGYSWCMAFVYWCFREAGVASALLTTGGVLRQWNERPKLRVTKPRPGDIFIMDYGKGLGHTGIVERVEGDQIHTIEGNTNDEGSREGFEVCRRVRPIAKCKGFLRVPA